MGYVSLFHNHQVVRSTIILKSHPYGIDLCEAYAKNMTIQQINERKWYLARHLTTEKKRQSLFNWLAEMHITPWTPLRIKNIPRSDRVSCRRKVSQLFPGYCFLKLNFDVHSVDSLRRHPAFVEFVHFGGAIKPVSNKIVDGLMILHPDPSSHPAAACELAAASRTTLTPGQFRRLVNLEENPQAMSRISLLLELLGNDL